MNYLNLDDRQIAYRGDGQGTGSTILCVHGSGASHAVWESQYQLEDEFDVVGIDLSGHGKSDNTNVTPGADALDVYAADVKAVARETDAEVVIGHSLGGIVALHATLESELEPAALILAGAGAKMTVLPDLLEWCQTEPERAIDFLHEPNRLFYDVDEETKMKSKELMLSTDPEVFYRDFKTCDEFDVRGRLDNVTVPALAITGEHDVLTPLDFQEYLAEHIPDAEYDTVSNAAHLSMMGQPDQFNQKVQDFLS